MANYTGKGQWVKGQSGNPAGPPPRGRALTALLEAAGETLVAGSDTVTRKQWAATAAWTLLTEGTLRFATTGKRARRIEIADAGEWMALYKQTLTQVDGPPPAALDVTSGGEQISQIVIVAPTAPPVEETE